LSDRVRVTVQLVGVDQAAPLWAEIFDEKLADIFEIEDRVSRQLAAALIIKLTDAENRSLTKRYTRDTEAYQSYLRGRYFWNRRTPEGLDKAIECFRQAIDRDRDYALPYAGIADCYNIAGFWIYLRPVEAFPLAAEAAAQALKCDDELADAHASLAWATLHYDWDRRTAEREYRRAIELNPGYLTAHQWYSLFLMQEARFDEALQELECAHEIDPLSLAVALNMGLLGIFTGRYADAIAHLKRAIELEPNYSIAHNFLGLSYFYASMFEESIAEYRRCVELLPSSAHIAGMGCGYALAGRTAEARAVLDELHNGSHPYVSPMSLAQIYLHVGEKDRALECLERACDERDPWSLWNKVNPVFESIRSEPRFQELLRRVGLEP